MTNLNFSEAYTRDKNTVESSTKINRLENDKAQLMKNLEEKGNIENYII